MYIRTNALLLVRAGRNIVSFLLYHFAEFEVTLVVVFKDDMLVTENFPIQITRN